jgi:hypothetical protein
MNENKKTVRESMEAKKQALNKEFRQHEPQFKKLRNNFMPTRGMFEGDHSNRGSRKYNSLLKSTPVQAVRTMSSGMMAGITSPARPWFRLATPDPSLMEFSPVKVWMAQVETLMREVFNRSNLYNTLPILYKETGVIGTGAFSITQSFDNIIHCRPYTVGEYRIAEDAEGNVDTFLRESRMTVKQAMWLSNMRGGKPSNTLRNLYDKGNYEEFIDVTHVVCPNLQRDKKLGNAANKRFSSVYYESKADGLNNGILGLDGMDEFQVVAPRWDRTPGTPYGTDSPGMMSLGDALQLQKQMERKAKAIAKVNDPPTQSPTTGKRQKFAMLPGSHNEYAAFGFENDGARPIYQINPDINALVADAQATVEDINEAFFRAFVHLPHPEWRR